MLFLTHLLWVGEVGRMPVAMAMGMSMGVGVPVSTDMRVAVSRMVMMMMVGGHRGSRVLHTVMMFSWYGSLSHRHVNRRFGGLRTSGWGFVRSALLGEGLELCDGDDRRRSRWVVSPGSRSSCL